MYWIKEMQNAIRFIEDRLLTQLDIEVIAKNANSSSANFQRIFSIVTGMTVGEYIRARRLSLAAQELLISQEKVLDIALRFGYETAESFTKAFSRFHNATPSDIVRRKSNASFFAPISINVNIRGGFNMSRKIIPNVPVIDNYGNEVDYGFNLLKAIFEIAGETVEKAELAVYSGMANRFVWTPGKWAGGNEVMDSINETPFEAEIRLLQTIGWVAKYITVHRDKNGTPLNMDNEQMRNDFVNAIDRGYPILFQTLQCHRLNMVIGYESDGQKLIVKEAVETSGVHVDSETNVYDNWEDTMTGYILLKEKCETAPERERLIDLFKLIVSRAHKKDDICNKKVGFAAWQAYLHDLKHSDFSAIDENEVSKRLGIYMDGLCQIWARNESLQFYRSLAERYTMWREELLIAVTALDACANYAGFLWTQGDWRGSAGIEQFRSFEGRKILADEGQKAMENDMVAINQFEKILQKEGIVLNTTLAYLDNQPLIERINEKLEGDELRNIMNFIRFCYENDLPINSNKNVDGWAIGGVDGRSLGFLQVHYKQATTWTIFIKHCDFETKYCDFESGDTQGLKEFILEHLNYCKQSECHDGWKKCGGYDGRYSETIFGKRYERLCHQPLVFYSPNAEKLANIMKLFKILTEKHMPAIRKQMLKTDQWNSHLS